MSQSRQHFTLTLLAGRYAVCQLEAGADLPGWASAGALFSVMRTPDELSVVCVESEVPSGVLSERGWRILKLHGPFPFGMTGVLASILVPLASAEIGIFALSTYNTDYVLVKEEQLGAALTALREAGHTVFGDAAHPAKSEDR